MKRAKNILYLVLLMCSMALSHPHVFIDVECEIIADDGNLKGFELKWIFDQMYSFDILNYLTDGNAVLTQNEHQELEKNFKETFGLTTFNTHILIGENDFDQQEILNFEAEVTEKRQVIFKFYFPYYRTLDNGPFEYMISFYDETLYYAYAPLSPPKIKGTVNVNCDVIKKNDVTYTIKMSKK